MRRNSLPEVREKLSRPLTISDARKVWRVIFSRTGASFASISAFERKLFGEHLGVARNDGERRVDLMGDARREQADGGEFFGLRELGFELHAVGDVRRPG